MHPRTDEERDLMHRLAEQGIVQVSKLPAEDCRMLLSMMIREDCIDADELRSALKDTADYVCEVFRKQAEDKREQRKRKLKDALITVLAMGVTFLLGRLVTALLLRG